MKFGIFYELQLPRPWSPDSEHQLYLNALDQVALADKLGYDYAWQVEHHFLEDTHTRLHQKYFSVRQANVPRTSGLPTASCS